MAASIVVTPEDVELTITAFTRLDQRGDKKAMNKLAARLQREQPHLLQFAASSRTEHGDKVGEAAVFYATLVWAMFDRTYQGTLPRLTAQNLAQAEHVVRAALAALEGVETRPVHERVVPTVEQVQPHVIGKLRELVAEDVREDAMSADTAAVIYTPTQIVVEAFDAALSGRREGERQGTVVAAAAPGRNEPCPCGSGKKFKKCHGATA